METGFVNFHDQHISITSSPLYDENILEDSDTSILDIMHGTMPYEVAVTRNFDTDLWGTEQELNGDMAVLPLSVSLEGNVTKIEPNKKEDFQKMLTDWQEHLGSLQTSDNDDIDVKDMVGLDVISKQISEHLPDDIFEDEKPLTLSTIHNFQVKDELKLEQYKDIAIVAENEALDLINEEDVKDSDEDCIDVETISEQIPVLEAGDLTSLLEQFEASEAFNSSSKKKSSLPETKLISKHTTQIQGLQMPSSVTVKSESINNNQNVKNSFPKEILERIKVSDRKKIPIIPAMPSIQTSKGGTRMQDAGMVLSRNKLLKIVSGIGGGESVQLDHDYCTVSSNNVEVAAPHSFYHSNAAEYSKIKLNGHEDNDECKTGSNINSPDENIYSRLPEYYMVLAPEKIVGNNIQKSVQVSEKDECWGESNSRKDSGLESGEVSDASEETSHESVQCSSNTCTSGEHSEIMSLSLRHVTSPSNCSNIAQSIVADNGLSIKKFLSCSPGYKTNVNSKEMTMISVLKKYQAGNSQNSYKHVLIHSGENLAVDNDVKILNEQQGPKKRKLNLQEYRSRLKELDHIRECRTNDCSNSSVSVGMCMIDEASKNNSYNNSTLCELKPFSVDKVLECEVTSQPAKQNMEVQTLSESEVQSKNYEGNYNQQENDKDQRLSRARDRWKNHCRSRHASSSSSSSSSSSDLRSSRQHCTSLRSRNRKRPSYSSRRKSSSQSSGSKSSRKSPLICNRRWRHSSQHDYQEIDYRSSCRNFAWSQRWRRSSPPLRDNWKNVCGDWQISEGEKQRQVEERRVIYVGRIEEGTSKAELRRRFETFGPIVDISVHFREHGDNYGFVTFGYKVDAYEAVEHGNDDPNLPHYDLCFGGRRAFCKTQYADLDGIATQRDSGYSSNGGHFRGENKRIRSEVEDSFDLLLREAQDKLRKRKV